MDDKRNLALLRSILELFGVPSLGKAIERAAETRQLPQAEINNLRMLRASNEIEALMSLIPEAATGIQNMSSKFASKLSARLASRARRMIWAGLIYRKSPVCLDKSFDREMQWCQIRDSGRFHFEYYLYNITYKRTKIHRS